MSEALDLLVIGAGSLGARVAAGYAAAHPGARVVAETRSDARHASLRAAALQPRLRSDATGERSANVLLAIPPSAAEDYTAEATRAAELFSGAGRLVMVSSTAVYVASDGEPCTETGALAQTSRAQRLLAAEAPLLAAGGCVLRMAGLYDAERGPHRWFARAADRGPIERRPDGLVNLIHYDDAADLCLAALARGEAGAIYMGSDGTPLRRDALAPEANFVGQDGPRGRRCDNSWTRAALDWSPRFPSFAAWQESQSS